MADFEDYITEVKENARRRITEGAVTDAYKGDRQKVIQLLNDALASELVCVLRYRQHYYMASGIAADSVRKEFLEHAEEEQTHVNWLTERITQLNGVPNYNPKGLADQSVTQYKTCETTLEMIEENLVAERIVIQLYSEFIRYVGNDDPTTRRVFEKILADEEEHAEDLATLLGNMGAAIPKETAA